MACFHSIVSLGPGSAELLTEEHRQKKGEKTGSPRAAHCHTCHVYAHGMGSADGMQQAGNSVTLPWGRIVNIFEQIQTPPNVLLLLKHTCMLSLGQLFYFPATRLTKPRSVHPCGLTPALSLLHKIGLCLSVLTVPGHTSLPSSLDHRLFSLIQFSLAFVSFGPLPLLTPPSFLSSPLPPRFLSGSHVAHAALNLSIQLQMALN